MHAPLPQGYLRKIVCGNQSLSPSGESELYIWIARVRTHSTTIRDGNLQFQGVVSTGWFWISPVDFSPFSPGFCESLMFGKELALNMNRIIRFPGRTKRRRILSRLWLSRLFLGPEKDKLSRSSFSAAPLNHRISEALLWIRPCANPRIMTQNRSPICQARFVAERALRWFQLCATWFSFVDFASSRM